MSPELETIVDERKHIYIAVEVNMHEFEAPHIHWAVLSQDGRTLKRGRMSLETGDVDGDLTPFERRLLDDYVDENYDRLIEAWNDAREGVDPRERF